MDDSLLGLLGAPACACGQDPCFVRGTRVSTPRGDRPIEDLEPGDKIFAFDVTRRRFAHRRVVACHRARASEVVQIVAGDIVVRGVTVCHSLYDAKREAFIRVDELDPRANLVVWLPAGDPCTRSMSTREVIAHEQDVEVFKLSVEGPEQTYFADGVLAHNKSNVGRLGPRQLQLRRAEVTLSQVPSQQFPLEEEKQSP